MRLQGRRSVPSGIAQAGFEALLNLCFEVSQLVTGRLAIRGFSGPAVRWGEGWFEEFRDGGLGWTFGKTDRIAVDERVSMLLESFRHVSRLLQVEDQS